MTRNTTSERLTEDPDPQHKSVSSIGQEVARSDRNSMLHTILNVVGYKYGLALLWLLMIIVFSVLRPDTFMTRANFAVMFGSQSSSIVLALALVVALAVGEFDLSVASILGLSATLVAVLNGLDHWPIVLAIIVALISGMVAGVVNAVFVVILGIDGIVITLGMGTLLLGLAIWVSHEEAIGGVSTGLQSVMSHPLFGVGASFYYALAIAAIVWYILRRTALGRHMLFVGSTREVARLVGVSVNRIRFGSYVASGLLSAVAGIMAVGLSGGFLADTSQSLLLPAFAAAFLGAAVVVPGRFNAWGTVVAILFLITGITGIELLGLSGTAWISQVFYGGALVLAVTVSNLLGRGKRGQMRL